MVNRWPNFVRDERGAITVDWVVLAAAVVSVTLLLMSDFTARLDADAGALKTKIMPMVESIPRLDF